MVMLCVDTLCFDLAQSFTQPGQRRRSKTEQSKLHRAGLQHPRQPYTGTKLSPASLKYYPAACPTHGTRQAAGAVLSDLVVVPLRHRRHVVIMCNFELVLERSHFVAQLLVLQSSTRHVPCSAIIHYACALLCNHPLGMCLALPSSARHVPYSAIHPSNLVSLFFAGAGELVLCCRQLILEPER